MKALADGCDEIVIVGNREIANIGRLASVFLSTYASCTSHKSARKVKERLHHVAHMSDTSPRIHVITPSSPHTHRWQFHSEYATLNELVDLGIKDATTFIAQYTRQNTL